MCIHFLVLQCGPQSVPLPHPFLSVCSTVLQRALPPVPPSPCSSAPENKTAFTFFPGWRSHSQMFMLPLSSAATPLLLSFSHGSASSHGRSASPQEPAGVQRLLQSQHKHLTDPRKSENTSVAAQKTADRKRCAFSPSRKVDVCSVFCPELRPHLTLSQSSQKKLAECFKM